MWPPKSPDLNLLDYLLEDFSVEMERKLVRRVCRGFYNRDQLCVKVRGGYFENPKSQAKKMLNLEENYAICSIIK